MAKLPKSFYLKLCLILLVLGLSYQQHAEKISAIIADQTLNMQESVSLIVQEVMGLPNIQDNHKELTIVSERKVKPGNQLPYLIPAEVKVLDNFQLAQGVAEQFNQSLDPIALNQAFLKRVNFHRQNQSWPALVVGEHLVEGIQQRVNELASYHYMAGQTLEGADFRSLFQSIPDANYRLGENLYELFISAGDVHLSTWENPEILADYLFDVLSDVILTNNYEVYHSQFIMVRVEASDYQVEKVPYVRLVVSLILDTQA